MAKKKSEETEETVAETRVEETAQAAEDAAAESKAGDKTGGEEKPAKKAGGKAKKETADSEAEEETSIVEDVIDAAASVVENVVETVSEGASALVEAVAGTSGEEAKKPRSKRAERVGIVSSDKMTKTVVVRVDRQVKHPIYRKYIKRKKKFMAHDELGSTIGDKVRIVETRPLSARKRWRVVEIIQKAEK